MPRPVAGSVPWQPWVDVALAVEPLAADDLEARAASADIVAFRDDLLPGRRREYLAGRLAARASLQELQAQSLTVGRNGLLPQWPSGFCGSISHGAGLAVAIAGHAPQWRALGIDIEPAIAADRRPSLRYALTTDEMHACEQAADADLWTRTWAAKEAAYKCCGALGADPLLRSLVAVWTDASHGHMVLTIDGKTLHVELRSRVAGAVVWVAAGIRSI